MSFRALVYACVVLGLIASALPLAAQHAGSGVATVQMSLRPGIKADPDTRPTRLARLDNGLVASFDRDGHDGVLWAGLTRSSNLLIRNEGGKAVRDILIRVRGEGLSVDAVKARGLRWRRTGEGWLAALASLAPGQTIPVSLAVTLRQGAGPEPAENAIVAWLRVRDHGVTGEARSAFTVADCAAAYHTRLMSLQERLNASLDRALARSAGPDASLPGRWLFRPNSSSVPRALRSTQAAADAAVANRGADPFFRRAGVDWLIGKLRNEIDRYAGQEPVPAMCVTPAPMIENLQDKVDRIKQQAEIVANYHDRAAKAAPDAVKAAVEAIRGARGGFPYVLDDGVREVDMEGPRRQDQVAAILKALFVDAAEVEAVRAAPTPLDALQTAGDALDGLALLEPEVKWLRRGGKSGKYRPVSVPNPTGRAVTDALGAIERAAYVDLIWSQHDGIHGAFTRTLAGIQAANGEACVCGY